MAASLNHRLGLLLLRWLLWRRLDAHCTRYSVNSGPYRRRFFSETLYIGLNFSSGLLNKAEFRVHDGHIGFNRADIIPEREDTRKIDANHCYNKPHTNRPRPLHNSLRVADAVQSCCHLIQPVCRCVCHNSPPIVNLELTLATLGGSRNFLTTSPSVLICYEICPNSASTWRIVAYTTA